MSTSVTEKDREFAAQIIEDFGEFEEGIEDQEKMAQWVRNVRKASVEECVKALQDLLALPVAEKELSYLDKGIGTKLPMAAWLRAREVLSRVNGVGGASNG